MSKRKRTPAQSKYIEFGEPLATFFNRFDTTMGVHRNGAWIVKTKDAAYKLERQLGALANRHNRVVNTESAPIVFSEQAYVCVIAAITWNYPPKSSE